MATSALVPVQPVFLSSADKTRLAEMEKQRVAFNEQLEARKAALAQYNPLVERYNQEYARYQETVAPYNEAAAEYNRQLAQRQAAVDEYNRLYQDYEKQLAGFKEAASQYDQGALADYQRQLKAYEATFVPGEKPGQLSLVQKIDGQLYDALGQPLPLTEPFTQYSKVAGMELPENVYARRTGGELTQAYRDALKAYQEARFTRPQLAYHPTKGSSYRFEGVTDVPGSYGFSTPEQFRQAGYTLVGDPSKYWEMTLVRGPNTPAPTPEYVFMERPMAPTYSGPAAPVAPVYAGPAEPVKPEYGGMAEPTRPIYTGPSEPVAPFTQESFEQFQQEAQGRAQQAAGQRALAAEVYQDPSKFGLAGFAGLSARAFAKGGEVKDNEPRTKAGRMMKELGFSKVPKEKTLADEPSRQSPETLAYSLRAQSEANKDADLRRKTLAAPGALEVKRFKEGGESRKSREEVPEKGLEDRQASDIAFIGGSRRMPGLPEPEDIRSDTLGFIKRMDDASLMATASKVTGMPFSSPTQARVMLQKMLGDDAAISASLIGMGRDLPERIVGYSVGARMPAFGGQLNVGADIPRGQGSPMFNLGYTKRFQAGGEVMSPEEQPVVQESSSARALRELIRPMREGIKGYFGLGSEGVGSEAYRVGQAMGNMPGIGLPAMAVAGTAKAVGKIPANKRLLLMPCSDMKCETPAEAKDLYKGVFYQTYRKQVQPGAEPHMMILSAKHGFVGPKQILEPYDQKMTPQQAEELAKSIKNSLTKVEWPEGIEEVMLVGGKHYQRVMNAALDELKAQGKLSSDVSVRSTRGEIGEQRSQLGQYLREMADKPPEFSRGGEVTDFIVSNYKDGGEIEGDKEVPQGPITTPLRTRTRRPATQEENEALSRAVLQGFANLPYNVAGIPGDIANLLASPTGKQPFYGSESAKALATQLGIRPSPPTDPTSAALYGAADIGSSLINPAAPVRAAARGAERAGAALSSAAKDFQEYNRMLDVPGAAYAVKKKGGQWLAGEPKEGLVEAFGSYDLMSRGASRGAGNRTLEEVQAEMRQTYPPEVLAGMSEDTQRHVARSMGELENRIAIKQWIDGNLTNYIKNDLGTPDDPLRKLGEQGITHLPKSNIESGLWLSDYTVDTRKAQGFPEAGFSSGRDESRAWENLADEAIFVKKPSDLRTRERQQNPWVEKLQDPNTPLYALGGQGFRQLGFDHVVDVLTEDLATGRLNPNQLNKVSVEQAVRRTHEYDEALRIAMEKAQAAKREGLPVYKAYPETSYRWIELNKPGSFAMESDAMGHSVRGYEPPKGHPDWIKESGDSGRESYGHGGWEAIKSGKAKVYSLVDETGSPHATIEMINNRLEYPIGYSIRGSEKFPRRENFEIRQDKDVLGDRIVTRDQMDEIYDLARENAQKAGLIGTEKQGSLSASPSIRMYAGNAIHETFLDAANQVLGKLPDDWVITQIKGKSNSAPKTQYQSYIRDFQRSGNFDIAGDMGFTGFRFSLGELFTADDQARLRAANVELPKYVTPEEGKTLADTLYRLDTGKDPNVAAFTSMNWTTF